VLGDLKPNQIVKENVDDDHESGDAVLY